MISALMNSCSSHFRHWRSSLYLPLVCFWLSSCAGLGHPTKEREPEAAPTSSGRRETLAIVGLNDLHGALAPEKAKTREPEDRTPISYERGGAAYLASYLRILREKYGSRLLILDAGDQFQGSIESNLDEGAPVIALYNALGLTAATIGNHEFDFGPVGPEKRSGKGDPLGVLKERLKEAKFPYVVSNTVDKKTGLPPALPNTQTRLIVQAGGLKVGLIGLTTLDTPVTTRAEYVRDLRFTSLKEATLRESKRLRQEGAQVVLVMAHVGMFCNHSADLWIHKLRKPTDAQGKCDSDGELHEFLRELPEGTIDGVVSGHTHSIIHHWIGGLSGKTGTPVIQSGTRNQYFNILYLTYDWDERRLVGAETRIEGPVPVCPKVFEKQGDCNGTAPAPKGGRGDLVTPRFHDQKIGPDPAVATLLEPVFDKSAKAKSRIVGQAAQPLTYQRSKESPLGNLVTDALREHVQADVAIMNAGGIRAPLEQGPITYGDLFRTLPFDNYVSVLTLTGAELKTLLRLAENASRGLFPVSGLRLRLIDPQYEAPVKDLNQNHRIEPWEVNRLIEARTWDGKLIQDQRKYRVATMDFLVTGGDDLGWIMRQIPASRIQLVAGKITRDAVEEYLSKHSPVNTPENPLVDPDAPRFKMEKPPAGKRQKHGRHRNRQAGQ